MENPGNQSPLPAPPPKAEGNRSKKAISYYPLFELGIEFAFILALPLIGGVYLGKWLDSKYGTKFIVVIGILLALGLSSFMIYRKIKELDSRLRGNDK